MGLGGWREGEREERGGEGKEGGKGRRSYGCDGDGGWWEGRGRKGGEDSRRRWEGVSLCVRELSSSLA